MQIYWALNGSEMRMLSQIVLRSAVVQTAVEATAGSKRVMKFISSDCYGRRKPSNNQTEAKCLCKFLFNVIVRHFIRKR